MRNIQKILLILCSVLYFVNIQAQTNKIEYPYVTYRSIPHCVIYRIETDAHFTKVYLYYKNPYPMGWVNFSRATTLKDLGRSRIYNIVYTEGVPLSPQKKDFELIGEGVYCSMFFPPIPKDSKYIEINENVEGGFHFVLKLESNVNNYSSQYAVMNNYIKKKREEETLQRNKAMWEKKQRETYSSTPSKKKIKKNRKALVKDPDFKID